MVRDVREISDPKSGEFRTGAGNSVYTYQGSTNKAAVSFLLIESLKSETAQPRWYK
jgi:hypothetical protein